MRSTSTSDGSRCREANPSVSSARAMASLTTPSESTASKGCGSAVIAIGSAHYGSGAASLRLVGALVLIKRPPLNSQQIAGKAQHLRHERQGHRTRAASKRQDGCQGNNALDRLALSRNRRNARPGRPSRYAPCAWYWTCSALRRASIVSSTVRRTVVSSELSAPPPLIASATAAIDTLSGASQRL